MAPDNDSALSALQRALASGDMQTIRAALLSLDSAGVEALTARLGAEETARLFQATRRATRGPRRGKVILLHGIMGGQLDSVRKGKASRVWLNYWQLNRGHLVEMKLAADGGPWQPDYDIRVNGMFPEYLPMLSELATQWDVAPFAYDWRRTIDDSATRLAELVRTWGKGEPVHLVAHSMGGLVSRRFVAMFPQLWDAMKDTGGGRGGRLIMLGTPNRGSFAIPLVLTGEEGTVKKLALLDFKHAVGGVLDIINTFPGSYQMLPSPRLDFGDDRLRLYEEATWGKYPVPRRLLDEGKAFQAAMHGVIDPPRMIYVAGYDRRTPFRIRVDSPGKFSYQTTLDGDGRVPHELGLLEEVANYWVSETHGDLPRNRAVLAGIHDLLVSGTTDALLSSRPARRGGTEVSAWQKADEIDRDAVEDLSIIAQPLRRGRTGARIPTTNVDDAEAARREAEVLASWLGGPPKARGTGAGIDAGPVSDSPKGGSGSRRLSRLAVSVEWGDITKADADVFISGHYERVLPQFAELALDRVISGLPDAREGDPRLVITDLTRRGILSGSLGQVMFFPWAEQPKKLVGIANMGHPGGFGRPELRRLSRNLTWAIAALPRVRTAATVLIGSGAGNMETGTAVTELMLGLAEALVAMTKPPTVRRLVIGERDFRKAHDIHAVLRELAAGGRLGDRVALDIDPEVRAGDGGAVDEEQCLSLALAANIHAAHSRGSAALKRALSAMMKEIPARDGFRSRAEGVLESFGREQKPILARAQDFRVVIRERERNGANPDVPRRFSFVNDGTGICAAAITHTAVVPERRLSFDLSLVREAVTKMIDPEPSQLPALSAFITRLIIPRDFRDKLERGGPVIFEVDRFMAQVHWEMLAEAIGDDGTGTPIGKINQVARQLRTTYSPAPALEHRRPGPLRALVIGDPGDPNRGESLPGAREEAWRVAALLRRKGVDVTLMIGAPSVPREGRLADVRPASRIDVLSELMRGDYDLLHYAGHGDFDPKNPESAGWLFEGGLIRAAELERIDLAPRLVFANACLSALTSEVYARGGRSGDAAALLPSLADEFFRRGVRNYVGTAWEVDDLGAVVLAEAFYEQLIPEGARTTRATIGEALLAAREQVIGPNTPYGSLWAAYQHYGDPTQGILPLDTPVASSKASLRGGRPPARKSRKGRRGRRS